MFARVYEPLATFKRKLCKFTPLSLKIEETRELSPTPLFHSDLSFLWMNEWTAVIGSQDDDVSHARHQRNRFAVRECPCCLCLRWCCADDGSTWKRRPICRLCIVIHGTFRLHFGRTVKAKWFERKSVLINCTSSHQKLVRKLSSARCGGNRCACSVGTIKQSSPDVLGFSSVWIVIRLRSDPRQSFILKWICAIAKLKVRERRKCGGSNKNYLFWLSRIFLSGKTFLFWILIS